MRDVDMPKKWQPVFVKRPKNPWEILTPEKEREVAEKYGFTNRCDIIVPIDQSAKMTHDEAASFAMQYTRKHETETGFVYDVATDRAISPIYAGGKCNIDLPQPESKSIADKQWGEFHTHPHDVCLFSESDVLSYYVSRKEIAEASVGCPELGNLVRRRKIQSDWDATIVRDIPRPSDEKFRKFEQVNYWLHGGKRYPAKPGEGEPPSPVIVDQWAREGHPPPPELVKKWQQKFW